jgi:hypothetical protein
MHACTIVRYLDSSVSCAVLIVTDQGWMNTLDPGSCGSKWNVHMWGEGEGLPPESAPPDSCLCSSRKSEGIDVIRRSAASPHSGRIAAGSSYNSLSMLHSEIIILIHNLSVSCVGVCTCLCFFRENKSVRCPIGCIDPLSMP